MKLELEGEEVTEYFQKDETIKELQRKLEFSEELAKSLTAELLVKDELINAILAKATLYEMLGDLNLSSFTKADGEIYYTLVTLYKETLDGNSTN